MADAWGASWGGTFVVWGAQEQVTVPTFGPPFIDTRSALRTSIGAISPLVTALGMGAPISPHIELESPFPSSRIDRSSL